MPSEDGNEATHEFGIINRAADKHGDDHAHALPAHDLVQHLGPLVGAAAFGQRIEDERLIRAAGHALGHAAEDAVGQAAKQENDATMKRRDSKQAHLQHHETGCGDDERLATDSIGEHAGGQIGEDDGKGPGEIQQRVFGRAQAQIEE